MQSPRGGCRSDEPERRDVLRGDFALPAGRNASSPLTGGSLGHGAVIVSTLPDIRKHACALQVLDLEEHVRIDFPGVRLVHIASDDAAGWQEVDWYHRDLRAEGYTLAGATESCPRGFTAAFGVAWAWPAPGASPTASSRCERDISRSWTSRSSSSAALMSTRFCGRLLAAVPDPDAHLPNVRVANAARGHDGAKRAIRYGGVLA